MFQEEMKQCANKLGSVKLKICRSMVQKPRLHCAGNWGVLSLIALIVLAGGYFSIVDLSLTDFLLQEELDVQNDFALTNAQEQADSGLSGGEPLETRSEVLNPFSIFFLYESPGRNLFTARNVKEMCETEKLVFDLPEFKLFCPTREPNGTDTVCDGQPVAISQFFYPGFGDCVLLDQEDVDQALARLLLNPQFAGLLVNSIENPTLARSTITLGGPLGVDSPPFVQFNEIEDSFTGIQANEGYEIFAKAYEENLLDHFGLRHRLFTPAYETEFFSLDGSDLQVRTHGFHLGIVHFRDIIQVDQLVSGGSFFVVTALVYMYVRSVFFAFSSMVAVALSVVVGLFLYAVILGIDYFHQLLVVVLFIVLALGANNVFVLVDAWDQSEAYVAERKILSENKLDDLEGKDEASKQSESALSEETLIQRLNYAYGRAALSVTNTSMTTFIAFLATAVSPIAPIASFGLFAALTILVNLIYMFNVHPANMMVHYMFFVKPRLEKEAAENAGAVKPEETGDDAVDKQDNIDEDKLVDGQLGEEEEPAAPTRLERFLDNYLYLINETKFSKISALTLTIYGGVMFSFFLQLETPSSVESNFKEKHMFTSFPDDFNNLFTEGSDATFTPVEAVFGIESLNNDGVPKLSSDPFRGVAVFDEEFEISSQASQDFIIEFCEKLPEIPCDIPACTIDNRLILARTIRCMMPEFRAWHIQKFQSSQSFVTDIDGNEVLDEGEFRERLDEFLRSENGTIFVNDVGIIDDEIKFHIVRYRKTMKVNQPLLTKQPVLALFNDLTAETREEAPPGLQTFYQTSFDFIWQHTEQGLVDGLYSGMAISLAASFAVMFSGTRNLLVSGFAIVGVAAIVVCVLGTVQSFGWELGTAEAVAGVMVIGLAVDYIVHLGYMFVVAKKFVGRPEGEKPDRISGKFPDDGLSVNSKLVYYNADMIEFSVRKMASAIFMGAFTTFSAGVFLLLCSAAFFVKMAVLIILTVVYSVTFAFCFFVPMLRIFGPGKR